jgi:phosphomannomutase/phosphoglucomutase
MSIFREYDIRGIVPDELDDETVRKIGYALSRRIDGDYVAVGYDARLHSPQLFSALASGLASGGKTILKMGMVPTPVNYFAHYQPLGRLLPERGLEDPDRTPAAAVMITGSHNPPEYNGFKITVAHRPFFGEDLYALGREVEAMETPLPSEPDVIPIRARELYIDYMVEHFSHLRGMRSRSSTTAETAWRGRSFRRSSTVWRSTPRDSTRSPTEPFPIIIPTLPSMRTSPTSEPLCDMRDTTWRSLSTAMPTASPS